MKVLNEYPGSHHYFEEYEKTEYFCPQCGNKEVFIENSSGDYYCGPSLYCISCKSRWTMQGPDTITSANELSIIEQLRTGKTFEPTTKRGN